MCPVGAPEGADLPPARLGRGSADAASLQAVPEPFRTMGSRVPMAGRSRSTEALDKRVRNPFRKGGKSHAHVTLALYKGIMASGSTQGKDT